MHESYGNKKLKMILTGQFYCYMLPESRGALADVHRYIQYATFNDTHQFTLCVRGLLEM